MALKIRKSKNACAWPGSRWDFWEEGISSSLLALWLTCREQFRHEVVEGWRGAGVPLSLAFGTCMHWCLAAAYARSDPLSPAACAALVKAYEKLWRTESPNPSAKQREVQEMVYGLADAVLPVYMKRWAGDFKNGRYPGKHNTVKPLKWVELEKPFKIPYVYPDGRRTWIRGTRDALIGCAGGRERVFDTKCRSVIIEDDTEDTLATDLQQMLYIWTRWKETKSVPLGTTMNIIRRPGLRQGADESARNFFLRVMKDVQTPKRWDHYFMRFELDVEKADVKKWEAEFLHPVMADFRAWWEGRSPHYMNPLTLITKYGRCAMFNPIVFGNTAGLHQRKKGSIMAYQTRVA